MSKKNYPSNLTNAQWEKIKPLLFEAKWEKRQNEENLREVVDAILYINNTNCEWADLPQDFPPWEIVFGYFQGWKRTGTLMAIYNLLEKPKEETMGIVTKKYIVEYDRETSTLYWQGVIRLEDLEDYQAITQLLNEVVALEPSHMTLNIRKLKALNSSGISVLGRFLFNMGEQKKTQSMVMQSTKKISWQKKWAKNFQHLMPSLLFEWE